MPILSYTSPDLEKGGAIIDVTIFPPLAVIQEFQNKKERIPSKTVVGLIDTGASCTLIDSNIAAELNLIARDKQPVLTPSGESEHWLYDILVSLEKTGLTIPIQALEAVLDKQPYKVLIGRDVFRACTLIYNGWNNSYDLHLHREKIIF